MTHHRPRQITDHHLTRLAVLFHYVGRSQREADPLSVTGDPEDCRQQALHWGWPPDRIIVIPDKRDTSSPDAGRDGLRRLRALVAREEVGIIVTTTHNPHPQPNRLLPYLFDLCRNTNTLIAVNGIIADPDAHIDPVLVRIHASLVEWENQRRIEALMRAKRHYATEGRAVSRPPTGYIKIAKGQWAKDIPAVQEPIQNVFRLYDRLGSQAKVVRYLVDQRLEMPIRTPSGKLQWVRPTVGRIHSIITNPTYAGYYVYGRHAAVQGTRNRKRRNATSQEQIVIPNHHDAYIPIEEWRRINSLLKSNASGVRRLAGKGAAA